MTNGRHRWRFINKDNISLAVPNYTIIEHCSRQWSDCKEARFLSKNVIWLVFILGLSLVASGGEKEPVSTKTEVWLPDCSLRSLIPKEKINDEIRLQEQFRPIIEQGGYSLRHGYVVKIVVVLKPTIENEEITFILERMIFNDYDSLKDKQRTKAAIAEKLLEILPELAELVDASRFDPGCEKIISIMKLRVCS